MSRETAQKILIEEISIREGMLIEEIETLPERLINAMVKYHKAEVKNLGLFNVSHRLILKTIKLWKKYF